MQKQVRREAILAAAESLIRQRSNTDFSMIDLAKTARLSPATPYNLFGTKSAILYALLNQSADRIFAHATQGSGTSPIRRALGAAEALAKVLTQDPVFYRPLYAFLMGVPDPTWRPAFIRLSLRYWSEPFVERAGERAIDVPLEVLGRLFVIQALGCVEMWVHQEINDASLAVELRRSCSALLLGHAANADRSELMEYICWPADVPASPRQCANVS